MSSSTMSPLDAVIYSRDDWSKPALVSQWVFFGIASVFVGLRIIARTHFGRSGGGLGLDDWITLVCMLVFLGYNCFSTVSFSYGLGKHYDTLDPEAAKNALRWALIAEPVVIWQFSLPKFAIVAILHRIISFSRTRSIIFWGLATLDQIGILVTSIWWVNQCTPTAYQWDPTIPGGHCADVMILTSMGFLTSAFSVVLDLFYALYPIPSIMRLNMPFRTRIIVAFTLGLSGLAVVPGITKLILMKPILTSIPLDPTYAIPLLCTFTVAEGTVNLICASLPALGPLLGPLKRQMSSLRYGSGHEVSHHNASAGGGALESLSHPRRHHRRRGTLTAALDDEDELHTWTVLDGVNQTGGEASSSKDGSFINDGDEIPLAETGKSAAGLGRGGSTTTASNKRDQKKGSMTMGIERVVEFSVESSDRDDAAARDMHNKSHLGGFGV